MSEKARFTQGQITTLLKGAQAAGMTVTGLIIEADGSLAIELTDTEKKDQPQKAR